MRETRHLWVGNLPENSREERIADLFKRYGRVEKVKFLSKRNSNGSQSALVAFVDIRSAQKAHLSVNTMGDKQLQTSYSEPTVVGRQDFSPQSNSRSSSSHRSHPQNYRGENTSRPHEGERPYSSERHRNDARDLNEEKSRSSNKDKRDLEVVSPLTSKPEKKFVKGDNSKLSKKKAKKVNTEEQKGKKASKQVKNKDRGRSPTVKRKPSGSKKSSVKGSSSDEEATTSSSYSSSRTSSSNSHSSSSSNSSGSTGTRSTGDSDPEIVGVAGGEKLVTMIIKKLPVRPSVNSLRDGIYHEFKKCGKVKSVLIRGDNNSRHALVLFRTSGEANKAVGHAKTKLLFGAAIEAAIYEGEVSGKELQECGGIIDEFHPRSSRTLFVGNLDKTVGYSDIQNIFVRFGEIVAIEIKKQNNVPQYAFLQYTDVASVVKAIQKMDGERLGKNTLKLGFGKTVISSCIWVEGVTDSFTEHYLASCFQKYGNVERVVIDRNRGQALVFYLKYEQAQQALNNMRGRKMNGSRLKLDYASQELIELFLSHMQSTGQSVTTFDSIRHLLLPAPSSSGAPPSLPQSNSSRTSRSSSSHPYTSEPYYDEGHRYPPAPPNFDISGPSPSRGDWRSWDDRNRSRPVYQGVSPRGRRGYDDERHERDYYHREDDYYQDRPPPSSYDPEHRSRDFPRDHQRDYGPPSRGYNEDYHRGVKPGRDRRERDSLYHSRSVHSPMSRPRRSRSFSPRASAPGSRGRGRDYDIKSDSRGREHPDHPMSRGRTPTKSPGSRESRGSGSEAWGSRKIRSDKYASPASHPSPVRHNSPGLSYNKRDERRVEIRELKNLSPKSSKVRSSVVKHDAWQQSKARDVKEEPWSPPMDYDRSRSETPTRDENLDSIGEIIIKQPVVSSKVTRTIKQEVLQGEERKPKSRTGSRTSSCHSERELDISQREAKPIKKEQRVYKRSHILQRVHSSSASEMSSDGQKRTKHSKASKKQLENKTKLQVLKQHSQTSDSDSDHRFKGQTALPETKVESKTVQRRKSSDSNRSLGLIKREFSPSVQSDQKHEKLKSNHQRQKSLDSLHQQQKSHDKTRKHLHHQDEDVSMERERSTSSHKKRRHSERSKEPVSDSDQSSSPSRKERKMSESSKLHHHDNNDDMDKFSRRSRRTSHKHEAPMSIASQCYQDEIDDDVIEAEVSDREPSSQFPQRHILQEEVVIQEEMEEKETVFDNIENVNTKVDKKLSSTDHQSSHISKVSQPFVSSYNPYLMKPTSVRRQQSHENNSEKTKPKVQPVLEVKKESTGNLTKLELEKQRLEGLLCKLDSEQNLEVDEANAVADVYLENIENKLKSKTKKVKKEPLPLHTPTAGDQLKSTPDESLNCDISVEVPSDLMDVPEFEIEEEEQTFEEIEEDVVEKAPNKDQISKEQSPANKDITHKDVDSRQGYRKQMEAKRKELQREKEIHSLIRKQKKEDEKHKRRIEKLRGPSQGIVSSIDAEEMEEETKKHKEGENIQPSDDKAEQKSIEKPEKSYTSDKNVDFSTEKDNSTNNTVPINDASEVSQHSPDPEPVSTLNLDSKKTVVIDSSQTIPTKHEENMFVSPSMKPESKTVKHNRLESTESTPQKPTKSPSLTQKLDDLMKMVQNKTPVSTSPYTPKSTSSVGKSSQASQKSGSSRNNSPSPSGGKRLSHQHNRGPSHPHQHLQARKSSSSSSGRHSSHHNKTPSSDKKRRQDHHRHHHKRVEVRKPVKIKPLTTLTVSLNVNSSEPLGKKELEILKAELETMKSQLDLDSSSYLLSPDSEEDQQLAPVSPILKSPNGEPMLTPDASSVDSSRSLHRISPSFTSLTERLKLLGRVKKKVKEERIGSIEESVSRVEKTSEQRDQEFKTSRLLRSSIFDQDLARLSHLQNDDGTPKPPTTPGTPLFSNFIDPNDLIISNNKPLFSAFAEKSGLLEPQCTLYLDNNNTAGIKPMGVKTAPKNVLPLSSDLSVPATAESSIVPDAGKVAEQGPKDDSSAENIKNSDQVDSTSNYYHNIQTSTTTIDTVTSNIDLKSTDVNKPDSYNIEGLDSINNSKTEKMVVTQSSIKKSPATFEPVFISDKQIFKESPKPETVDETPDVESNITLEAMDIESPSSFLDVDSNIIIPGENDVKEEIAEDKRATENVFVNKDEENFIESYVVHAPEVLLTEEIENIDDSYKKQESEVFVEEASHIEVEEIKQTDMLPEEQIQTVEVGSQEQEIESTEIIQEVQDHHIILEESKNNEIEPKDDTLLEKEEVIVEEKPIVSEDIGLEHIKVAQEVIPNLEVISEINDPQLKISKPSEVIQLPEPEVDVLPTVETSKNSQEITVVDNINLSTVEIPVIKYELDKTDSLTESVDKAKPKPQPSALNKKIIDSTLEKDLQIVKTDIKHENVEVQKENVEKLEEKVVLVKEKHNNSTEKVNMKEKNYQKKENLDVKIENTGNLKEKMPKSEKEDIKSDSKLKKLHKKSSVKVGKHVIGKSDKTIKSSSDVNNPNSSKVSVHKNHDKLKTSISKPSSKDPSTSKQSSKEQIKSKTAELKEVTKAGKDEKSDVKKENVLKSSKSSHDTKPGKQEAKPSKSIQDSKFLSKLSEPKSEKKAASEKSFQHSKTSKSPYESSKTLTDKHGHSEKKSKDPNVAKSAKSSSEKPAQDLKLLQKASSLSQKFEKRSSESKPKSRDSSFEKSKSLDEASKFKHSGKKKHKEGDKKKLISKKHKLDDDSKEKHSKSDSKSTFPIKKKEKSGKHESKKEGTPIQHNRDPSKSSSSKLSKHHKTSGETDQPVKKKPRLEEKSSKKIIKKSEPKPQLVFTDSDESDDLPSKATKKPASPKTKNRHDNNSVKPEVSKKEPQRFPERKVVSDDSDSSDQYDNFISQMNKSFSKSSKKLMIYTSDEDSSEHDHSPPPKPKIKIKVKKLQHVDSDHSDQSTTKKKFSKTTSPKSENRKEVKSINKTETKKAKGIKSDKKALSSLKSKDSSSFKPFKGSTHNSDVEEPTKKKSVKPETKPLKIIVSSDSSSSSDDSDYQEKSKKVPASEAPKTTKPVKPKDQDSEQIDRKSSSSSLESLDYPPPSPPSTNLTTQTIKDETLVSSSYVDFGSFRSSDKEKSKETKDATSKPFSKPSNLIYTSSSSDSDSSSDETASKSKLTSFDNKNFIKEFTSSSSDSDDFNELLKTSSLAHEQKEKKIVVPEKQPRKEDLSVKKSADAKPKQVFDKTVKKETISGKLLKSQDSKHFVPKPSSSHPKVEKKHKSSSDVKTSKHQILGKDGSKSAKETSLKHLSTKEGSLKKTSSLSKDHSPKPLVTSKSDSSKHLLVSKDLKHHSPKESLKHKKEGSLKLSSLSKESSSYAEKKNKPIQKIQDEKSIPASKSHTDESKPDESKKHIDKHKLDKSRKTKKIVKHSQDPKDQSKVVKDSKHHKSGLEKAKHIGEGSQQKLQTGFKSKQKETPAERKISKETLSIKQSADSTKAKSPQDLENIHKKLHQKSKSSVGDKLKKCETQQPKTHSDVTRLNKPEMKKQTGIRSGKPSSSRPKPSVDTQKSSALIKKQEAVDSDSNAPGKGFFDIDSPDSDNSAAEITKPRQFVKQPEANEEQEKAKQSFTKFHASPVRQKSLFSPPRSKDEEPEHSVPDAEDIDSIPKQSKTDHDITSKHHHKEQEIGNKKKKNIQKIHESAKSKPDLVSSFERIQAEKKSRQEERERQKKLSQQRDEEAVRSIMSGDETSDSMYLTDTSCKSDLADTSTKLDTSATSIIEPIAFVKQESVVKKPFVSKERKPSQSDTSVSSSSDVAKPDPEPLSTAEEMELAAAVSSIEGNLNWYGEYGDKKEEATPVFQPSASFETSPKRRMSPEKSQKDVDDDKGRDEAAMAASALMMEEEAFHPKPKPFSHFEKSDKTISPWRRNPPSSQEKKKQDTSVPLTGLTSPPTSTEKKMFAGPGLTSPNDTSPKLKHRDSIEKPQIKHGSFETQTSEKKWNISNPSFSHPTPSKPSVISHAKESQPAKQTPSRNQAWSKEVAEEPLILPTIKSDEPNPFISQTPVSQPTTFVKQSSVEVVKEVAASRPFVPVASPARKERPKPEMSPDIKLKDPVPMVTNPPISAHRRRSKDQQSSMQKPAIEPPGGARVHASPRSYGHHLPASISLPVGSRTNQPHNDPHSILSNYPPHHTSSSLHSNLSQSPQRPAFFQPPAMQDINKPQQHVKPSSAKPNEISPVSGAFKLPPTQPFVVPGPELSPSHNFTHFPKPQTPTSSPLSLRTPFFPSSSLSSSMVSASTNPSQHQLIYSQKGVEPYQVPPHHMLQNVAHRPPSVPQRSPTLAQRSPTMTSIPSRHMSPNVAPMQPSAGHLQMAPIRIPNYPPSTAATSPTRPPIISPKLTSPPAVPIMRVAPMAQPTPSPTSRMQIPISVPLYTPPQSVQSQQTTAQQQHPKTAPSTTTQQPILLQHHQQQQQVQPVHFQPSVAPASSFQMPILQQNPRAFHAPVGLPVDPKKTTTHQVTPITEAPKMTHPMSPYGPQASMFYPGLIPYPGMHFPNFPRYLTRPLISMPQQRSQPGATHMLPGQSRSHVLPGQQTVAGHTLPSGAPLTHLLHRQPGPGHALPGQPHLSEVRPMSQPQSSVPKSPQKQQFFYPHIKNDAPGIPKPAQTPPRAVPSPIPSHPSHQLPRQPQPRHTHPSQGHRSVVSMTSDASMDMVEQHFRKSGVTPVTITSTQHTSVPPSGHHQTTQPRPGYPGFPQQSYRPEIAHLPHQPMAHVPHPYQHPPEQNYPQSMTPNRSQPHHLPPSNSPYHYPPVVSVTSSTPGSGLTLRHTTPPLSHPHHNPPVQPVVAVPKNPTEQQEAPQEPASLQELFKRYPVIWQGKLALKTESAAVQIHYVSGDMQLGQTGLPKHSDTADASGLAVLRIIQRMRINQQQLEGISKRMMMDNDFCMLLALPCGRDKEDVARQTSALSSGFIEYLQQKQVAGIVNVDGVLESTQQRTSFVVHIFPPCEFTTTNLQQRAPDLLTNVADIHHLLIVITTA